VNTKNMSWLVALLVFSSSVFSSANSPIQSQLGFRYERLGNPTYSKFIGAFPERSVESSWSLYSFFSELPLVRNLSGGFSVQLAGAVKVRPETPNVDSNSGYHFGIDLFIKPRIAVPFFLGNLAIYGNFPVGPFYNTSPDILPKVPRATTVGQRPEQNSTKIGVKTGVFGGVEYFPVSWIGLFLEAGYQVFWTTVGELEKKKDKVVIAQFIRYDLSGLVGAAGIKFAY